VTFEDLDKGDWFVLANKPGRCFVKLESMVITTEDRCDCDSNTIELRHCKFVHISPVTPCVIIERFSYSAIAAATPPLTSRLR